MPDLFFNMETGATLNKDKGFEALLSASKAYKKYQDDFKISSGQNPGNLKIIRQGEICHSLKDCFRFIPLKEQEIVKFLLHGLSRGAILSDADLKVECEDWLLAELGLPSPILEYAAKRNGIALTVATDQIWEKDFFYFQNQTHKLPNLWTDARTDHIDSWLSKLLEKEHTYGKILKKNFNGVRCEGVLKDSKFTPDDWERIFATFEDAKQKKYKPDDSLIKATSHKTDRWGAVLELRLMGRGLRVFFVDADGKVIIGGHYFKGQGASDSISQNKAIKKAKIAINNFKCGINGERSA